MIGHTRTMDLSMVELLPGINFLLRNKGVETIVTFIVIYQPFKQEEPIISFRIFTALLLMNSFAHAANQSMVSIEVIPLVQSVPMGEAFDVAVVFHMDEGWHTYWSNPGDAGIPSTFDWTLPPGFEVVDQREPVPTRHAEAGITTFIHEEEAIYLFSIMAPAAPPDTSVFSVQVGWLECKAICQAGASQQHFSLPQDATSSSWEHLKDRALSTYPQTASSGSWKASLKKDWVELKSQTHRSKDAKLIGADFFPYAEMTYDTGKPVRVKKGFRHNSIHIPLLDNRGEDPQILQGVLVQQFTTPTGEVYVNTSINQAILQ